MNTKKILILIIAVCFVHLTGCYEYNTEELDQQLVSENTDPSFTPDLVYRTWIAALTPYDEEVAYYKIYEVKLPNGDFERRAVVQFDTEVFYLGPLKSYFSDVNAEFSFFQIQEGQFVAVFMDKELEDRVGIVKLHRKRTDEDMLWSVGADVMTGRGGISGFGTFDPRVTEWKELNSVGIIFNDGTEHIDITFEPPINIESWFVDVPYPAPIN